MAIIEMVKRPDAVFFRQADIGNRAAVEFEIIVFDAVAENHAILWHLRKDFKSLSGVDTAMNELR